MIFACPPKLERRRVFVETRPVYRIDEVFAIGIGITVELSPGWSQALPRLTCLYTIPDWLFPLPLRNGDDGPLDSVGVVARTELAVAEAVEAEFASTRPDCPGADAAKANVV